MSKAIALKLDLMDRRTSVDEAGENDVIHCIAGWPYDHEAQRDRRVFVDILEAIKYSAWRTITIFRDLVSAESNRMCVSAFFTHVWIRFSGVSARQTWRTSDPYPRNYWSGDSLTFDPQAAYAGKKGVEQVSGLRTEKRTEMIIQGVIASEDNFRNAISILFHQPKPDFLSEFRSNQFSHHVSHNLVTFSEPQNIPDYHYAGGQDLPVAQDGDSINFSRCAGCQVLMTPGSGLSQDSSLGSQMDQTLS